MIIKGTSNDMSSKLEIAEDDRSDGSTNHSRKMGRQKEGGTPATWENEITFIYCDFCIKEIELGNRPTTHFSKEGWRNLTKNFNERTGRTYDRAQLKNKWDQLKKDWKLWKDLMRGETGIGWNPLKKTIDASNEWWNEKIQAIPAAKKFRYNGVMPELEEKLDRMFSRVVATGEDVWIPNSGVLPPELREVQIESSVDEESQEDEPNTNLNNETENVCMDTTQKSNAPEHTQNRKKRAKHCRSGGKQLIMSHIEDLVEAARTISAAISSSTTSRKSFTILDTLEEISKIPEVYEDEEFYDFATDYLQDRNHRDTFMGIPSDRKVWWLRRRFLRTSM